MDPSNNISLPNSAAEMNDILDIEGIVMPQTQIALYVIAGVVLLALLIWLSVRLVKWWNARRKLGEEVLKPLVKALRELDRLKQQKFLERGEFRKYYFFASEILRRFIEEEHGYRALEKTTQEIVHDWESRSMPFDTQRILNFLNESDQVKFADVVYPMEQMQSLVGVLEKILKDAEKKAVSA